MGFSFGFSPRWSIFTWFFVTFQCLRADLASKDAQLKVCAVKSCYGMWTTVLAMIALKENLAVLLLSVMSVVPVHEAIPCCKSYFKCPQTRPPVEDDSNGK